MHEEHTTRRGFIGMVGATGIAATAGCAGFEPPQASLSATSDEGVIARGGNEEPFVALYEAIAPGVIELVRPGGSPFEPDGGSGFLIDDETIVTNAHVTFGADEVDIRFQNGDWASGSVVQEDLHSDLAVIVAETVPTEAKSLSFEEAVPAVGTAMMAIGAPFGLSGSASVGIVSGVNRSLPSLTGFTIPAAIQTDAAVNPGSSGGPLVDRDGLVRGIVFAGAGDDLGFAISAKLAGRVIPTLRAGREFEHSYIGITMIDVTPPVAEANDLEEIRGIIVENVIEDTPADGVLRGADEDATVNGMPVPIGGDVIVAINGEPIDALDALSTYLAIETTPGDRIRIDLRRDGTEETVELELGARPENVAMPLPP